MGRQSSSREPALDLLDASDTLEHHHDLAPNGLPSRVHKSTGSPQCRPQRDETSPPAAAHLSDAQKTTTTRHRDDASMSQYINRAIADADADADADAAASNSLYGKRKRASSDPRSEQAAHVDMVNATLPPARLTKRSRKATAGQETNGTPVDWPPEITDKASSLMIPVARMLPPSNEDLSGEERQSKLQHVGYQSTTPELIAHAESGDAVDAFPHANNAPRGATSNIISSSNEPSRDEGSEDNLEHPDAYRTVAADPTAQELPGEDLSFEARTRRTRTRQQLSEPQSSTEVRNTQKYTTQSTKKRSQATTKHPKDPDGPTGNGTPVDTAAVAQSQKSSARRQPAGGAKTELAISHTLSDRPHLRDSGDFTEDEAELLRRFIKTYQERHELATEELVALIQWTMPTKKTQEQGSKTSKTTADELQLRYSRAFWFEVYDVLPLRKAAKAKGGTTSIQRFVRRRYHIFKGGGNWEPEEDAKLHQLYEQYPNRWKTISQIMGNRAEDACRDRWRNYVRYGSNRKVNSWTSEEEERLVQAVADVLSATQLDPDKATSAAINWQDVSSKLEGTRSRMQCRSKWLALQSAGSNARRGGARTKRIRPRKISSQSSSSKAEVHSAVVEHPVLENKTSLDKMRPGDKLDVISAIMELNYSSEDEIDWDEIDAHIDSPGAFTATDRKAALQLLLDAAGTQDTFFEALVAVLEFLGDSYSAEELDEHYEPVEEDTALASNGMENSM